MATMAQTMLACSASSSGGGGGGNNNSSSYRNSLGTTAFVPSLQQQSRRFLLQRVALLPRISAVKAPEECNEEECAPAKEVGKLSLKWEAEEKTKVIGTYPPVVAQNEKRWTGYVEKDTAGQTNIYAVEPTVYVAESAISTGSAGGSVEDSNNSLAVAVGLGLIAVVSASSILLQVGQNTPTSQDLSIYSGPPLSYYVAKFSPTVVTAQAAVPEAPVLDN